MPKAIVVRITWSVTKPLKLFSTANNVYAEMTANVALFSTPTVPLKDLKAANEEAQDAYNKRLNGDLAKEQNKTKLEDLSNLLRSQAIYVNGIAKGNSETILKAGFEATNNEVKKSVIPASTKAAALQTLGNGALKANLVKVEGATSYTYVIFLGTPTTITVDGNTLIIGATTEGVIIIPNGKTFQTIYNLPIGTTVTVVAFAQNSAGVSAASPAASRLIN
jgi:hypothetical protein